MPSHKSKHLTPVKNRLLTPEVQKSLSIFWPVEWDTEMKGNLEKALEVYKPQIQHCV